MLTLHVTEKCLGTYLLLISSYSAVIVYI